jgi:N-acetylmuramoyl-L-alanine amidase
MTFIRHKPIKNYTKAEFKAFFDTLHWTTWHPYFAVWHNTAGPTIGEWNQDKGEAGHEKRLEAIDNMYANVDHWHSGVHIFVAPEEDGIWNPCDLTSDGVHASCFNARSFGMETIGNFASPNEYYHGMPPVDDWNSKEAQQVRDNAVFVMAVIHKRFGWEPDHYVYDVSGLHFHRECKQDHHNCPGGQVDKSDIVARIKATMLTL